LKIYPPLFISLAVTRGISSTRNTRNDDKYLEKSIGTRDKQSWNAIVILYKIVNYQTIKGGEVEIFDIGFSHHYVSEVNDQGKYSYYKETFQEICISNNSNEKLLKSGMSENF